MSVEAGFVEDLDVKGIIGFDGATYLFHIMRVKLISIYSRKHY